MQKVFFMDVDETLLPLGQEGISAKNVYAVHQLQKQNYDVYIATGKSLVMIEDVIKLLQVDKSITSNGNVITEQDNIIYSNHIAEEEIYAFQKIINQREDLILGGQGNNGSYLLTENKKLYQKIVKPIFDDLSVSDLKHTNKVEENLYQLWILGNIDDIEIDAEKYDTFRWEDNAIDVIYKGTSKAKAINHLLNNKYKNKKIQTYAFGDSLNDVAMFKVVDYAVAVSNAKQELKEVANYVCDNSQNEGIYNFLIEQKLIKKMEK